MKTKKNTLSPQDHYFPTIRRAKMGLTSKSPGPLGSGSDLLSSLSPQARNGESSRLGPQELIVTPFDDKKKSSVFPN